jgi:hypothetical protein
MNRHRGCLRIICWVKWLLRGKELKLKLIWPTVSWSVCLGIGLPSGAHDQSFVSCLTIAGFLMWAPSLTRGWVCSLLLQFAFAPCQSSHSQFKVIQNSRLYFTVSVESPPPPPWRARSLYLYPPGEGWPGCTPGHWVPFSSPLTTRRAWGERRNMLERRDSQFVTFM